MASAPGRGNHYGPREPYEEKLARVMRRFEIRDGDWDWNADRHGAQIWFTYRDKPYTFSLTVAETSARKVKEARTGSDCFAVLVLTLEDLARMAQRGVYELSTWLAGLEALPSPRPVAPVFVALGFDRTPTADELDSRYRELALRYHPDSPVGSHDAFLALRENYEAAKAQVGAGHG